MAKTARSIRFLLVAVTACWTTTAAFAQYDGFQLPPGIENTRIPRQLPSVLHPWQAKPAEAAPDEAKAYSLKEFKLGMSLDDFTKLGPPVGADRVLVKGVCSCDANQTLEVASPEDAKAKTVVCGFWSKAGDVVAAEPYRMTVASIQTSPDFRFIEDGGIYRLMEISISFYSSNFKDMENALTAKYGNPAAVRKAKITTESGNIYSATNLIWDNGVSRIRLSDVDGNNTSRAKLRFIQLRLYSAYSARLDSQHASPVQRASDDL
jgi:hypothetical protein